jgi:ABC-type uncharacterized transport system fused permease/ATPase subunit
MTIAVVLKQIYNHLSWSPFTVGKKMAKIIKAIDTSGLFVKHLVLQTAFALTSNYILFNINNNIMESFGKLDNYVFTKLPTEDATIGDWNNFKYQGTSTLYPVFMYISASLISHTIENLYDNWIAKKINQQLSKKVFNDNQVGIKLTNSDDTAEIVRNLPNDIQTVTKGGIKLFKDLAKNFQNALMSIQTLYTLSNPISILGFSIPDLLLFSFLYSGIKQLVSSMITNKRTVYSSQFTMHNAKSDTIISHDFANVKAIFTAGAQNAVSEKHSKLMDKTDSLRNKLDVISSLHSVWLNLTGFANGIYKYIIAGHKVFTKLIPSDNVYATFNHFGNVDNFFSWPDIHQAEIKELEPRLDRLQKFLDEEHKIIITTPTLKYMHDGHKLTIKDFTLISCDKKLLDIEKMCFEPGQRYVFSGSSGCGKSSLIAKINGIIQDGITATGLIQYPMSQNKKMMLTQEDYFPAHTTLLDIMCLPAKPPVDKTAREEFIVKAEKLLEEANIGRKLNLQEEKTNWSSELSGGQKKKIKAVSAILQKPDLLLLDEAFVGVDPNSIKIIQDMLVTYLPSSTTIIAVDHHPGDQPNFYTSHYKVEGTSLKHQWGIKSTNEAATESKGDDSSSKDSSTLLHRVNVSKSNTMSYVAGM